MKRIFKVLLSVMSMLFLATSINAQAPGVMWDGFYPGDYEQGNYTANDIKQSPYVGYVLVGSRGMSSQGNGYNEVMLMRVDEEGVHKRMWYPESLAPGTYFIQLESGGMVSIRKAVLAR